MNTSRLGMAVAAAVVASSIVVPQATAQIDRAPDYAQALRSTEALFSPGRPDDPATVSGSVKVPMEVARSARTVSESAEVLTNRKGEPLGRPVMVDDGSGNLTPALHPGTWAPVRREPIRVFAQWYEGVYTEHSSPTFYTEVDENGNFSLKLQPYVDAHGVEREFLADATTGLPRNDGDRGRDQLREKLRVWVELPESVQDDYRLIHQPAGIVPPTNWLGMITPSFETNGWWRDGKVNGFFVAYHDRRNAARHLRDRSKWVANEGAGVAFGMYSGQMFWNTVDTPFNRRYQESMTNNTGDAPAAGMTVVGSYLSDEAVEKVLAYGREHFGKKVRGSSWTPEDEKALQRWINEQVAKDQDWIAETAVTTTDEDGNFYLYWRGTYGNSFDGPGLVGSWHHRVAESWDEGSWLKGNANSKHINWGWSLVSILTSDGEQLPSNVGAIHPWALGYWGGPDAGGNFDYWSGSDVPSVKLSAGSAYSGGTSVSSPRYALSTAPLKFHVEKRNTFNNWAPPGEVVRTFGSGVPRSRGLKYRVIWYNADGERVHECPVTVPDEQARIASCDFTVPEDAKQGDTYIARLFYAPDAGNVEAMLAQDSFAVTHMFLEYGEPVEAAVGRQAVASPSFDNPASGPVEEKPERAEFQLGSLPFGVDASQVSVDDQGVVRFTPRVDQIGQRIEIPVEMLDPSSKIRLYNREGVEEIGSRPVAAAIATFVPHVAQYALEYAEQQVEPGQSAQFPAPTFDDRATKKRERLTFEGAHFELERPMPGVSIDADTGELTVEVWHRQLTDVEVPVVAHVPYEDPVRGVAKARVRLPLPVVSPIERQSVAAGARQERLTPTVEHAGNAQARLERVGVDGVAVEGASVELDLDSGAMYLTAPVETEPGDDYEIVVSALSTGEVVGRIPVRITENLADLYAPRYQSTTAQPGQDVPMRNLGDALPKDAEVSVSGPLDWGIAVEGDEVNLHAPKDATQGIVVFDITVRYKDGSSDVIPVRVRVIAPQATTTPPTSTATSEPTKATTPLASPTATKSVTTPATAPGTTPVPTSTKASPISPSDARANYADPNSALGRVSVGMGGSAVTRDPFADSLALVRSYEMHAPTNAHGWKFGIDKNTGQIHAVAPSQEFLAALFDEAYGSARDGEVQLRPPVWAQFAVDFQHVLRPAVNVIVEHEDGRVELATAAFELVDAHKHPLLDRTADADGDGVSNVDELEQRTNPFAVPASTPTTSAQPEPPTATTSAATPTTSAPAEDPKRWEVEKCIAVSVAAGVPLLLLMPLGIAAQEVPAVKQAMAPVRKALDGAFGPGGQSGVKNPEVALAGAGLLAFGVALSALIYTQCGPEVTKDGLSSQK
ncbi:YPDG domain-containing protein [Corynebacterium sp. NML130628]|uniref:YPDG domain-containing protein n=1 Tax=Corynebacterium sp. NML130628 TaxID=1906333 RepID=UPI00091839CF|nr:YPDG domain-containing protein [Corynebacterium sp. NML130628]OIR46045.1 hypothetical protein BJP07_02095 [Corynebacterium sp. NML130628]